MLDTAPAATNRELAAKIVAAYVRRNHMATDQLAALISAVHQALAGLGKPTEAPQAERTPAVPIRQSVHRDYVVCLECGQRAKVLRRHLMTAHGLRVEEYRARWHLPSHHPMTARAYSERRSAMARQIGLGRSRRRALGKNAAVPDARAETPAKPTSKRRGRSRSAATPA
jgi:predicted transcriptional regulator